MRSPTGFGVMGAVLAMVLAAPGVQAHEDADGTPTRGFVCDDSTNARTPTTADQQRSMTPDQALAALRGGEIRIVGAMYDLATGLVTFLEEPTQAQAVA